MRAALNSEVCLRHICSPSVGERKKENGFMLNDLIKTKFDELYSRFLINNKFLSTNKSTQNQIQK